jgi:hypothetical protein
MAAVQTNGTILHFGMITMRLMDLARSIRSSIWRISMRHSLLKFDVARAYHLDTRRSAWVIDLNTPGLAFAKMVQTIVTDKPSVTAVSGSFNTAFDNARTAELPCNPDGTQKVDNLLESWTREDVLTWA